MSNEISNFVDVSLTNLPRVSSTSEGSVCIHVLELCGAIEQTPPSVITRHKQPLVIFKLFMFA